jgi:hypothetical protein
VLLERELQVGTTFDVGGQQRKAGEAEAAERAVEMRSAYGHECTYAPDDSFPVFAARSPRSSQRVLPFVLSGILDGKDVALVRRRQLRISGDGHKLHLIGDWEAEPLDGLCQSARLARAVEKLQRSLVARARDAGRSWTEIGASLGISRQAAWERFSSPPD